MRALLFDLDGTLYTDAGAVPGAVDTVRALRARGIPYRFVTNTTGRPRSKLIERLASYGFEVTPPELLTPVRSAVTLCQERGYASVAPYVPFSTLEDLAGLQLIGGTSSKTEMPNQSPSAVIVGDLGDLWSFRLLQEAFGFLMNGADLVALSRDRYWMRGDGLTLDAGPFVAALEYATGKTAAVTGKPSAAFYHAAVRGLELPDQSDSLEVVMVGDDLWSDVRGAQQAGYRGWLVRTGKFRADQLNDSGIVPDRVLGSVAEVVGLLED